MEAFDIKHISLKQIHSHLLCFILSLHKKRIQGLFVWGGFLEGT
jgi:hypothetical protein